eukprot:764563-Hanusia_phi.AAC.1
MGLKWTDLAEGVTNGGFTGYLHWDNLYGDAVIPNDLKINGNIGIGTTPTYALDLYNGTAGASSPFIRLQGGGTINNSVGIIFNPWYGRSGGASSIIQAMDDGGGSSHLVFFTAPTGSATTTSERMRILNNGNVGIGTNTTTYKLDIN